MEGPVGPAVLIRSLSKTFAGAAALSDVGLTIEPGAVHALVGANGSGKSTLIKVLSGYHAPDAGGEVFVGGQQLPAASPEQSYRLGCRFVHQDLGLITTMSVADNLHMGYFPTRFGTVRSTETHRSARTMLERVGLDLDPSTRVADLGAAQRTGVALARAVRQDPAHPPRLLVLDEPTATLPSDEVYHLLDMVRRAASRGVAVLFVTHHLEEVFRIGDAVTVLRDGRTLLSKPIGAVTRREIVTLLAGDEFESIRPNAAAVRRAAPVLTVDELHAGPLRGLSLAVAPGEILGLAGITGSGRETALPAIFGGVPRRGGTVTICGQTIPAQRPDRAIAAGAGLLPGNRKAHSGVMTLSARENLSLASLRPLWSGLRLHRGAERTEAASWFSRLSVRPEHALEMELVRFSGGNQQKILFAKWMRRRPAVFLLDEPTQGVDIAAQAELHRQLLAAAADGMAVVVSSTDPFELASICSRVLVLRDGTVSEELVGSQLSLGHITQAVLSDTTQPAGMGA